MRTTTIAACLGAVVSLGATTAIAGTPFGGDDTGFVPPDSQTLRCENEIDRLFHVQTKGLSRCATRQAMRLFAGRVTDDVDEQTCKTAVDARIKPTLDALVDKGLCTHDCSDKAHFAQGIVTIEQTIAVFTGLVFCEGTAPWPGNGNGGAKIPSTSKALRCELRVGKAALQLSGAGDVCQRTLADRRFSGHPSFDDEPCHAAAEASYDKKLANASGARRARTRPF